MERNKERKARRKNLNKTEKGRYVGNIYSCLYFEDNDQYTHLEPEVLRPEKDTLTTLQELCTPESQNLTVVEGGDGEGRNNSGENEIDMILSEDFNQFEGFSLPASHVRRKKKKNASIKRIKLINENSKFFLNGINKDRLGECGTSMTSYNEVLADIYKFEDFRTAKMVMKIHGIDISDDDTDSDNDTQKEDFDDEYYKLVPPPLEIDPEKIVMIRSNEETNIVMGKFNIKLLEKLQSLNMPLKTEESHTKSLQLQQLKDLQKTVEVNDEDPKKNEELDSSVQIYIGKNDVQYEELLNQFGGKIKLYEENKILSLLLKIIKIQIKLTLLLLHLWLDIFNYQPR